MVNSTSEASVRRLRVLALEPYYGGSHQSYLDDWIARSRHQFSTVTLPAHHWKWRMRHAGVTLAERVAALEPTEWDVIWCSSMLPLTDFLALTPKLRSTPVVAYFHENQAAYPNLREDPRDVHFLFTQWTTTEAASEVWFNSHFNRDTFFAGLSELFRKVPDQKQAWDVERARRKSKIVYPGVAVPDSLQPRPSALQPAKAPHILWLARWEHDKAPELFFEVLFTLSEQGLPFRLSVLGQQYQQVPSIFPEAKVRLAKHIEHWGYANARSDYERILGEADIAVSTARHEFFGIAMIEAALAGCLPLVPNALAYPEILADSALYFDGSARDLTHHLGKLLSSSAKNQPQQAQALAQKYGWNVRAEQTDHLLEQAARRSPFT